MKRFLYTASVESVAGWQTFYIDAETREEADERAREHDTNGIYQEELSVEDIGRLAFDNETDLDDFGEFPPTAATPTPLADAAAIAEREAFEAWAQKELSFDREIDPCKRGQCGYLDSNVDFAWVGWQARAALATTEATDAIAPTEGAEPYCHIYEYDHKYFGLHRQLSPTEWNGMKPTRVVPVYEHSAPSPEAPAVDALATKAVEVKLPQKLKARAEKIVAAYLAECCKPGEIDHDARHEILCDAANLLKDILDTASDAHPASEPKGLTEHDAKGLEIIATWLDKDGLTEPAAMLRRIASGALLADRGSEGK